MATQIRIANLSEFLASVREAQAVASDLTQPLSAIARDWMTTNKLIFALNGPGPFADLSGSRERRNKKTGRFQSTNGGYKAAKLKRWGFVYPIGKASGRFEASMTDPASPDALVEIINGQTLILGTRVLSDRGANYPAFLQFGTRRGMPPRPGFFDIPELSVARWQLILRTFIVDTISGEAPTASAAEG